MSKKLVKAVLKQMGGNEETLQEWAKNTDAERIDPGFQSGIECEKFFDTHRVTIFEALKEQADDWGQDLITMVLNFGYWRNGTLPTHMDVAAALLGQDSECAYGDDVKVPFAWYALDHVQNELA